MFRPGLVGAMFLALPSLAQETLPVITGEQLATYAKCDKPNLPEGLLAKGTEFHISAIINEQGKIANMRMVEQFQVPYKVQQNFQVPPKLGKPAWASVQSCHFTPLVVDGKPIRYQALFTFTAP